jgi:site-specific recombinase XerD
MMNSDTNRLVNDLNVVIATVFPEVDEMKMNIRIEEIINNYEIHRKTVVELEDDISDKIDLFLASKKLEGLSESTLINYRNELNMLDRYFSKSITQITTADIRQFLGKKPSLKMSTIEKKLSNLKTFFGWLVSEEFLLRNPTTKIKSPKQEQRLPKALSVAELENTREFCETRRERAIIEIFYSTGCRLAEVEAMKKSDINYQDMSMRVIGKGNKERIVYLSDKAIFHLEKYFEYRTDDCDALLVTSRKPYRAMGARAIQRDIVKVKKRMNFTKKLHPHVMRHTYAQLAMDAGIELSDLQHLMGHSSSATTMMYAQVSEERKKSAFKKYHVQ